MSLLMQALRKAERARSQNGHEPELEPGQPPFGADPVPLPPPIEGGPAFAVMPDSWRLEPLDAAALDAEPPVVAAQEAVHDPVPPQARHEARRTTASGARPPPDARPAGGNAAPASGTAYKASPAALPPGRPRAAASSQRRLLILASALAALLAVFAFIYWRAVSGPGPGARLPMVPMPAPGAPPFAQGGTPQGAAIPVAPYVSGAAGDQIAQATAPASTPAPVASGEPAGAAMAPAMAGGAGGNAAGAAPATRPKVDVTIPTPEELAAIPDPAIRAEAMRDAAERAARQVRAEGPQPAAAAAAPQPPQPSASAAPGAPSRPEARTALRAPSASPKVRHTISPGPAPGAPAIKTAVGEHGDVQFVRGSAAAQVAPAVQHGYDALKSGDLATAHQQYDLALLQDPNNRDALLGAAAVALREHDGKQAASNYLRLLELDPNDADALAGLTELRPGELQANEIRLRGLARQHPESGPVQFALGNLYARQGRWPEAQQSYFRAFTAMPENADYAFNLGVGLDRMNQPRLAQTYYRRALELAQASPPGFNTEAVRKRLRDLDTPPQ